MDIIDLREKNLSTNIKYMLFIVLCLVATYLLPNISQFMKVVLTIIFVCSLGVLIWATFFIKNEIIFYPDKLVFNRYKISVEFHYKDIRTIKYSHIINCETVHMKRVNVERHYLTICYKNSTEETIELFGRVFLEKEINALLVKYKLN